MRVSKVWGLCVIAIGVSAEAIGIGV